MVMIYFATQITALHNRDRNETLARERIFADLEEELVVCRRQEASSRRENESLVMRMRMLEREVERRKGQGNEDKRRIQQLEEILGVLEGLGKKFDLLSPATSGSLSVSNISTSLPSPDTSTNPSHSSAAVPLPLSLSSVAAVEQSSASLGRFVASFFGSLGVAVAETRRMNNNLQLMREEVGSDPILCFLLSFDLLFFF
jgi:hypothetical protein